MEHGRSSGHPSVNAAVRVRAAELVLPPFALRELKQISTSESVAANKRTVQKTV